MLDALTAVPAEAYVLGFVAAVGLAAFVVMNQLDERNAARNTLRQLEGYQVENQRDQELLAPLRERLLGPVVNGFSRLGGRFNPPTTSSRSAASTSRPASTPPTGSSGSSPPGSSASPSCRSGSASCSCSTRSR